MEIYKKRLLIMAGCIALSITLTSCGESTKENKESDNAGEIISTVESTPVDEAATETESGKATEPVKDEGTTQFLSSQLETPLLQKMKQKDVSRLLRRTDDILCQLSSRVITDPSETYQSIF
ncbi:hypothetical protein [Paenibacillus sp. EKM211P]|uniref:hypothetical protein n=1 Tax=Paenibacillus sp. EKM211P TaxID=1683679 RepID=UPI0013E92224|nr:hypothetical protein [Paenibacillus sp. EKM211P]